MAVRRSRSTGQWLSIAVVGVFALLALLVVPARRVQAAVTPTTLTTPNAPGNTPINTVYLNTNAANGTQAFTPMTNMVLTESTGGRLQAGKTIVLAAPGNWQFNASAALTCSGTLGITCSATVGEKVTINLLTASPTPGAGGVLTLSGLQVRPLANATAGSPRSSWTPPARSWRRSLPWALWWGRLRPPTRC